MRNGECGVRNDEWAARPANPPRSVFGNYRPKDEGTVAADTKTRAEGEDNRLFGSAGAAVSLQAAIDAAMARSFLYRFLAQAYEDPTKEGWCRMVTTDCQQVLEPAVRTLVATAPALAETARAFQSQLKPETFESFLASYLTVFGHAARGRCPLNEIEYGELKADPLFQPHRLADLAAFYRAFGLEIAGEAGERHDHICLELEFMCVLAAKEAYALEHQLDPEDLSISRDAQEKFLREHLGRWTPAFVRRLARMAGDTPLRALADLTSAVIEAECARFGITPGSEDLLLRPVDSAAESMCHSCGMNQMPPGALASTQPCPPTRNPNAEAKEI